MHTTTLHSAQQAHQVLERLWVWMKPRLIAGQRLRLSIAEEKRSLPQNAKLHATLTEIARTREWAGQKWDVEDWKRLMTAAWMRANKQQAHIIPALDGQGFDVLYRHTSQLSKAECSDLLEYVLAWAAQNGVELTQ